MINSKYFIRNKDDDYITWVAVRLSEGVPPVIIPQDSEMDQAKQLLERAGIRIQQIGELESMEEKLKQVGKVKQVRK